MQFDNDFINLTREQIKYLLQELYVPYSSKSSTKTLFIKLRTHLNNQLEE